MVGPNRTPCRWIGVLGLLGVLLSACAQAPAPTGPLVVVPPVAGLESLRARALANAMAEELSTTQGLNARAGLLDEGLPAEAFVMGRVERADVRETLVWMTTRWAVMAPDGGTLGTVEREIVVDKTRWMDADPLIMGFAVSETGPEVLDALVTAGIAPPPAVVETAPAETESMAKQAMAKDATAEDGPAASGDPDVSSVMAKSGSGPKAGEPTSADDVLGKLAKPADGAADAKDEPAEAPMPEGSGSAEEVLGRMGGPAIEGVQPAQQANTTAAAPIEPPRDTILPGPPTPDPNAWARAPVFLVRPVYGAPGNGNRELTAAVRRTLTERGARVTESPALASHVMQGSVRVSPPFGGQQKARIVWLVTTVAGEEMGTATQENAVPEGTLDGSWGVIANHIAQAAVDGVQELFGVEIGRVAQ